MTKFVTVFIQSGLFLVYFFKKTRFMELYCLKCPPSYGITGHSGVSAHMY